MRLTLRPAALVLALVLALVACSDDGGETTAEATASVSASPSEVTDTPEPSAEASGGASGPDAVAQSIADDAATCDETGLIGYSQPLPDENFALFETILEQDAGAAGHEVASTVANLDPGKQIADIETLLQQGADVIVMSPVDPEALAPIVQRAADQDVPVVAIDAGRPGPYATNIQPGHADAARRAAEYLAEQVGDGQVTAIEGPSFAAPLRARNEGFAQGAEQAGLDVAARSTNEQITPDAARELVETWRTQYGDDLAGIWAMNDVSALGASSSVGDGFDPAIVSINGEPAIIDAIRQGSVTATYDLLPVEVGHLIAWSAMRALCGEELPEQIDVDLALVDASNVDEWKPWEEQLADPFTVELAERDGRTVLVTE